MRWKNHDGEIRSHSSQHHAHTSTGQPVYHDTDACFDMELGGVGYISSDWKGWICLGQGKDHHQDLNHHHEEA